MKKDALHELQGLIATKDKAQKARAFLMHLGIACEVIIPYLGGFHNSIDDWRNERVVEG